MDIKVLLEVDLSEIDIWRTMCAYDGWACSVEVHAFRWQVLHQVREVFSSEFAPAIMGSNNVMHCSLHIAFKLKTEMWYTLVDIWYHSVMHVVFY
jgi:hypothetical protein